MKTNLAMPDDFPDDLCRKLKALAASRNCSIKDLLSEALARHEPGGTDSTTHPEKILEEEQQSSVQALEDLPRNPPTSPSRIAFLIAEAERLRREGLNRDDLAP